MALEDVVVSFQDDMMIVSCRGVQYDRVLAQVRKKYGVRDTIVDLGQIYVGADGLGDIVEYKGVAMNSGKYFAICGASERMQKLLRLAKLDEFLKIYADVPAALNARKEKCPGSYPDWAIRSTFSPYS